MLFKPRKAGKKYTTLYAQCRQVEKSLGYWPSQYPHIEPPARQRVIWEIFWELRGSSRNGFSGPENLGFMEMDAWQRVRGLKLHNWMVDIILAMDAAYMAEWHRKDDNG